MKGPLKRSNLIQIGSKRNTEINSDTSGVFYNSKLGPMRMINPSALKQAEEETPFQPTDRSKEVGERNISALPSELDGIWIYDGTDIGERINDYEDRISFIEEDVWNQQDDPNAPVDMSQATEQQQKDHTVLTAELNELYQEREGSDKKGNIEPGYDEQGGRDETMDKQY